MKLRGGHIYEFRSFPKAQVAERQKEGWLALHAASGGKELMVRTFTDEPEAYPLAHRIRGEPATASDQGAP